MINEKKPNIYKCLECNFSTIKKTNYKAHLCTRKHLEALNESKNISNVKEYICTCGKKYKFFSGLSRHNKICTKEQNIHDKATTNITNMFVEMIKNNQELKSIITIQSKQLLEQSEHIKDLIPKIGVNYTTNKFNINVFLNERCKSAVNMKDFIASIKMDCSHLNLIKDNGFVDGLSNAIIENISKLSVFERPLYCTDKKREILYIKENDIWELDKNKVNITRALKSISLKPYTVLKEWIEQNPDCAEIDEKQKYVTKLICNMGAMTPETCNKIIKKICGSTYLNTNNCTNS